MIRSTKAPMDGFSLSAPTHARKRRRELWLIVAAGAGLVALSVASLGQRGELPSASSAYAYFNR